MVEASCRCGAVRIEVAERPQRLTSCNCSLCLRLGVLWAYYALNQVRIAKGAGTTVPYTQGDRRLAMPRCPTCGYVTHWESTGKGNLDRMAVNARLMEEGDIADVRVRRFDGAKAWSYLDE